MWGRRAFFSENGNVRAWPTCLLAAIAAAFASVESPFGFISYQPDQILRLMVPVSGVFVALALPAAQLAQSVKERLFAEAIDLLSSQQSDVEGVRKTLRTVTVQYRQALETMRLMIYLSLASFLTGLAGWQGPRALAKSTLDHARKNLGPHGCLPVWRTAQDQGELTLSPSPPLSTPFLLARDQTSARPVFLMST